MALGKGKRGIYQASHVVSEDQPPQAGYGWSQEGPNLFI